MPKKYNSQATIETIITVSARLFLEKGFDKTSIQDIADTAGISKGAIYHHFRSKEEIINAVTESQAQVTQSALAGWLTETEGMTGREKLIAILEKNLDSQEAHCLDEVMSVRMKSAEFVLSYMQNCVNQDAALIANLIEQGAADGSLTTDFPDECAEMFLLLLNVWCDPAVFHCDMEKLSKRLRCLQHLMRTLGMDVLSDELIQKTAELLKKLYIEEGRPNE